jgi:release factor glutamine methyltransferase
VLLGKSLKTAIESLTEAGVPSPRMNAELLLMFTLGRDRAYLYGHPEYELTNEELRRYKDALAQRSQGIPAQYITGHQEFWGMDLIVSPAVLIPRPETEHVIEAVLSRVGRAHVGQGCVGRAPSPANQLQSHIDVGGTGVSPVESLDIVDVGTGSGCIALALAKELPDAKIHATDISPAALEIARANAARHQLESRIRFYETDLLQGLEKNAFDFVVSNPPYVGESEEDSVQLEVRKFEPRTAVFAGRTGIDVIERLIPQSLDALKPGGWLIMEISGTIASRTRKLLARWNDVQITNDLQGIPRIASARRS